MANRKKPHVLSVRLDSGTLGAFADLHFQVNQGVGATDLISQSELTRLMIDFVCTNEHLFGSFVAGHRVSRHLESD